MGHVDWNTLAQLASDGLPALVGLAAYVLARVVTRWMLRPPSDLDAAIRDVETLLRDMQQAAAEAARLARAAEAAPRTPEPTGAHRADTGGAR